MFAGLKSNIPEHRPPSSAEPPALSPPSPAPYLWKEAAVWQFREYPIFLGLIKTPNQHQLLRLFQPPGCLSWRCLKTTDEEDAIERISFSSGRRRERFSKRRAAARRLWGEKGNKDEKNGWQHFHSRLLSPPSLSISLFLPSLGSK